MLQWLNRSHPPTLQAAVILGYISAVFGLIQPIFGGLSIIAGLLCAGGAIGCANNKKVGYIALGVGAGIVAALFVLSFVLLTLGFATDLSLGRLVTALRSASSTVFPIALIAAVLHPHSRTYMQAWFE